MLSCTLECHHNWKTTPAKLQTSCVSTHILIECLESDDTCGPGPGEFVHLGEQAMVARGCTTRQGTRNVFTWLILPYGNS